MVRIAHFSDLHLRYHLPGTAALLARHSRRVPELLAEAERWIRNASPDWIALTGDLLDFPADDLKDPVLWEAGERDLRLIAQWLDGLGYPYALVHGNHDHPALMCRVFGHLADDQVMAGYRVVCFRDQEAKGHFPERVGREREKLLQVLADVNSPPQVHVQHYLVWPERNESYPHTYRDAPALLEAIVGSGLVRLVLSGHYHAGIRPFQVGGTFFATVPAFCEAPYPFWVYDMTAEELVYREIRMRDRE